MTTNLPGRKHLVEGELGTERYVMCEQCGQELRFENADFTSEQVTRSIARFFDSHAKCALHARQRTD